MNNRNDFPASVKQLLCTSVSGHCSICGKCTTWVEIKKENIGEAAHIEAAAEGGPRYNPHQTEQQRASFENGIWLCSNCHKEIDSNPERYTVSILRSYKADAEKRARANYISVLLKSEGQVQNQDCNLSMGSFFSTLYGIQDSLHSHIKKIKIDVDNLLNDYPTKEFFETQYWFELNYGSGDMEPLSPKLSSINQDDLWTDLIELKNKVKEERLHISDISYNMEQEYLKIVGERPKTVEDWWRFINQIKNYYKELDSINTQLLNEYRKQYNFFTCLP